MGSFRHSLLEQLHRPHPLRHVAHHGKKMRLAGIDAPELEHPWGKKAKWELVQLCKGQIITAEIAVDISYDRLVATCYLPDSRDLSAETVRRGLALD